MNRTSTFVNYFIYAYTRKNRIKKRTPCIFLYKGVTHCAVTTIQVHSKQLPYFDPTTVIVFFSEYLKL